MKRKRQARIKIYLVDDHPALREGVLFILAAQGILVVCEAAKAALTAREREVLTLLAEGLANKEVARKLGISVRTAEAHREHLSRKLNIAPLRIYPARRVKLRMVELRS